MLIAALEPGKEIAIANFFLAIFCLFTVVLPLLLITRGDKTEDNRNFIAATINPWSQIDEEAELAQVVLSDITLPIEENSIKDTISECNVGLIPETEQVVSLEIEGGDKSNESSDQLLTIDDELLAA